MSGSLISIVTPAYNQENYIGTCIESVLAQTYENWEMLIVDDGSTDGTVAIAQSYRDQRIRIFPEQNRGISRLAETYNIGVRDSKGSVIAILEGDDYWAPGKLQLQLDDFADPAVVLSWGMAVEVTENGEPSALIPGDVPPEEARLNDPIGRAAFFMSSMQTFTPALTVVIRKKTLDRIGGFQQAAYTDYVDLPTFMTLSLEGSWRYHSEVLGYWRRHRLSTTRNRFPAFLNAAYRWTAEFVRTNADRIPATSAEMEQVDLKWNVAQKDRLLTLGRLMASHGKYAEASRFFSRALAFRIGPRTRRMIEVALSLCKLRCSPELAFRIGKQQDWRALMFAPNGDPLVADDMKAEDFVRFDLTKNESLSEPNPPACSE